MTAKRVPFLHVAAAADMQSYIRSLFGVLSWVVRATSCPDTRSAQEAKVLFDYGLESLSVAFGDPGNK